MFNTFAVVEPTINNGVGRPIIPAGPEGGIYDSLTLEDMLNVLGAGKAEPGLVKALNRVSDGIHVPRDIKTLEKAVEWFEQYNDFIDIFFTIMKDGATHEHNVGPLPTAEHKEQETADETKDDVIHPRITIPRKIVLAEGVHGSLKGPLRISSDLTIVGDPGVGRKDVVVLSGIRFREGIPENCHLQHMTLRPANKIGVHGKSSFTMEDVLVEQCRLYGVVASGTSTHCKCHNVVVTDCGRSGMLATDGATITLSGLENQMLVHHNCTDGDSDDYGLQVEGEYGATIQVVHPLTIETVSKDNINHIHGIMNFSPDALDPEAADRIIELTVE
jgi:hypothetical protein